MRVSQGDSRTVATSEIPFFEWNGYKYNLHMYPMNEGHGVESKIAAIKRLTATGIGLVATNKAILKTVGKMRLYASNDGSLGIGTIQSDTILVIKEIKVRHNSSSVYYARVESIDDKYKGWVPLSSIYYDLYIRGEKIGMGTKTNPYGTWVSLPQLSIDRKTC